MTSPFRSLPLRRVAVYGFLLNLVWEFAQCVVFYDMWGWSLWKSSLFMWGATFGDVLIVLAVALAAGFFVPPKNLNPPTRLGWGVLLGLGFLFSVPLEWIARELEMWAYSSWMPTFEILSREVGLLPTIQVTTLPAFSVYLATRKLTQTEKANVR